MRIYRNIKEGRISGVCAGIGDHFDIKHIYVRIAAVILAIVANGGILVAYAVAWFLMEPMETEDTEGEPVFAEKMDEVVKSARNLFAK